MKFVLKNNLVYVVENYGIPNNNIEGTVEAPGFEDYKIEYKVNNGTFKPIENNRVKILAEDLKKPSLSITFRALKDGDIVYFKVDAIPLTHAVILGKRLEEAFPERFRHLEDRMNKVEKLLKETEDKVFGTMENTEVKVDEKIKDTTHKFNGIIEETIEVFEDITRKGSLF